MKQKIMKVAVVGFGHIGSVIGTVLAKNGCKVIGVDKSPDLIRGFLNGRPPISEPLLESLVCEALRDGTLTLTESLSDVSESEVIIITVGTPLDKNYKADLSALKECCAELAEHTRDNQLIIIKSTVPPGTTRNVVANIFSKAGNLDVAFCPERLAEGAAIREFQTLPIIVGGVSKNATQKAREFWKKSLDVEVICVENAETAEMVKLANNAWIDLNIGLANELAKLSDSLPFNIDILETIEAANTLKKGSSSVNILLPSSGVGGYCLTKDPWFLYSLGKENGLELNTIRSGREANDTMPEYASQRIVDFANSSNLKASEMKVAVLGFSFKSNSGDIRQTPVIPFLSRLKSKGIPRISIFDPLVKPDDAKKLTIKLDESFEETVKEANCVAFMAAHDEFKKYTLDSVLEMVKPGCLIFDGRRYFSRDEIEKIKNDGLFYMGIGR